MCVCKIVHTCVLTDSSRILRAASKNLSSSTAITTCHNTHDSNQYLAAKVGYHLPVYEPIRAGNVHLPNDTARGGGMLSHVMHSKAIQYDAFFIRVIRTTTWQNVNPRGPPVSWEDLLFLIQKWETHMRCP
jgi:hypothetical protein